MKNFLAVLVFVLGVCLGLYLGLWVLLIGGIAQFVNGVMLVQALPIAIGIVKVIWSGAVGWVSFLLCTALATAIADA